MLDMRLKSLFFDRQAVERAVDKAKRQVLSRAGALVRTAARTSIRPRRGTSAPGQPPYSHVGLLRRLILFGYDRQSDSVVIGPVRLHKPGSAPHVLEFGGTTIMEEWRGGRRRRRRVRVRARPYMGPALARERDKLPALWSGSVRGG